MSDSNPQENKTYYVYGLTDPETGTVKYIGCSVNPLKRYQEHTNLHSICNVKKWKWLKHLDSKGMKAGLILLDECPDRATGRAVESDWITTFIADGIPLTNGIYRGYESHLKGIKRSRHYRDELKKRENFLAFIRQERT